MSRQRPYEKAEQSATSEVDISNDGWLLMSVLPAHLHECQLCVMQMNTEKQATHLKLHWCAVLFVGRATAPE